MPITPPSARTLTSTPVLLGCLRDFQVLVDADGDGTADVTAGPFIGFSGC